MQKRKSAEIEMPESSEPGDAVLSFPDVSAEEVHVLTIPQVAERLQLSRTKVYDLIEHEGLPVIRFGRAVRVLLYALAMWLQARSQSAPALSVSVTPRASSPISPRNTRKQA